MSISTRRRFRAHTWRGIRCGATLGGVVPTVAALAGQTGAATVGLLAIPLGAVLGGWAMALDADRRAVQPVTASATTQSPAVG